LPPCQTNAVDEMPADRMLDVAIVGAGIAGVIHLHYAGTA
jgi:cation diffusion facilitator CzcD-associated flavoprotein CzcO